MNERDLLSRLPAVNPTVNDWAFLNLFMSDFVQIDRMRTIKSTLLVAQEFGTRPKNPRAFTLTALSVVVRARLTHPTILDAKITWGCCYKFNKAVVSHAFKNDEHFRSLIRCKSTRTPAFCQIHRSTKSFTVLRVPLWILLDLFTDHNVSKSTSTNTTCCLLHRILRWSSCQTVCSAAVCSRLGVSL